MIRLITEKRDKIARLCRQYHVRRLELFGSAAGEDFDAEASDLDFLVEFQPLRPGEYADAYFGFLEALQDLLGRPIDLVMPHAVKNPYFLAMINEANTARGYPTIEIVAPPEI